MKCPKCHFENPEGAKFCGRCKAKLLVVCPQCDSKNPPENDFCNECGHRLEEEREVARAEPIPEGERKYVTVLFSDLSGYTAMSARLDPEEVKEITNRIFGEVAQVVRKYEGFIEKFIGDAVMALFGVPKAHEDDPIRAIRAGTEIHDLVKALSPQFETKTREPLSMHTGINTGLVVTGEVDIEKGTHGASGDTINLASRLAGIAKAGEILVGPDTYRQAEGFFAFQDLEPTTVKGKAEPVSVYKVLSPKERPVRTHRLSRLRADLIGRKVEMAQLQKAVEVLRQGKGTLLCICGEPGTGKSRLVEEFNGTLDPDAIEWREGHAYAYTQKIPYFPLIDLISRSFHIEDGDSPDRVREKVERGVEDLIGKRKDVAPYIGSLYALNYSELEGISPELWKSRLFKALQTMVSVPTRRQPTVVCLEDLHWADPSSLELLRFVLSEVTYPVLFLCVYRPPFSLFTGQEIGIMRGSCQEMRLQDLSYSETQDMLESLLNTTTLPGDLLGFVREKTDGNPFYVEEVINSLIESETLVLENGDWRLARSVSESDIPSTLQGVISARLDRLETEMKRILQEASVIGRAFLYQILKEVTQLRDHIDRCLSRLERLDLIRTRSLHPELEYVFKHALTQEVVYNGLLRKDRQVLHERIALVMERLFGDRLSEFYEALAMHFKHGQSTHKAIDYLMKSGEKCLRKHAVEESHQSFKEAYDLLSDKTDMANEEKALLVDLLIKWAFVFHYRGDFKGLTQLLRTHEDLAKGLDDPARLGMFSTLLGLALYQTEKVREAYQYLCKALELGEETGNQQVTGYACTWLSWVCPELGLLDEAIRFGERAMEISRLSESEDYLFFNSLAGMGLAHYYRGDRKRAVEAGEMLLDHGQRHSNIRSLGLGHFVMGCSHLVEGDFPLAIDSFQRAVDVSADPWYSQFPRLLLGLSYASAGRFQEAQDTVDEILNYGQQFGTDLITTPAHILLGVVSIGKGQPGQGLQMLEEAQKKHLENERRYVYAAAEEIIGRIYLQIAKGAPGRLPLLRNIGFLLRKMPVARRKAEEHLSQSIRIAREIGAKATLGAAYLDLGLLEKAKGSKDRAREYLSEAIQVLDQCDAKGYLKQAEEALRRLA